MDIELILPGLLGRAAHAPLAPERRPAALEALLAKARLSRLPETTIDGYCAVRLDLPAASAIPYAALSLLGQSEDPGAHHWLSLDPVHLAVNRDRLVLADTTVFSLSEAESRSLLSALDYLCRDSGIELLSPHPNHWYARLADAPKLTTHPLGVSRGRSVDALPLGGADAPRWQRLQSEIQMALHHHEVNAAREERGELPVNSVWVWGAGTLPALEPKRSPARFVMSDVPWVRGLARLSGATNSPIPASLQLRALAAAGIKECIMFAEDLLAHASYGNAEGWQSALANWEARYLQPVLSAIQAGDIGSATLVSEADDAVLRWRVQRRDFWKFWRKSTSLASVVAQKNHA
jgi:hypothetical protein